MSVRATHGSYATKRLNLRTSSAATATGQGSAVSTALRTAPITADNVGFTSALTVFLDITASSGTTPYMDVVIEGRVHGSGTWTVLPNGRFSRFNTTGAEAIHIDGPIPPEIRVNFTIAGTTPSFTFTVDALAGG